MILKRILLAEDDANDVELTLNALAQHNLANQVDVVRDGAEALDYLFCRGNYSRRSIGHPVVVWLDVKMPKCNGLEVLEQVKADPDLRLIPVVMLTSSREEKDLIRSYQLGANAYVVKPVEFHAFMKMVNELGRFWSLVNVPPPVPLALPCR